MSKREFSEEDFCPEGSHEWIVFNESFDHQFGTKIVAPYLVCNQCPHTQDMPEKEY